MSTLLAAYLGGALVATLYARAIHDPYRGWGYFLFMLAWHGLAITGLWWFFGRAA